jgi:homoserine O-succinyltransferase
MLRVGLVNNMGDGALEATERQFASLLAEAGGGDIELVRFFMPDVPRSPKAAAFLCDGYADAALIPDARLDALIVTGSEPRTHELRQEAHWDAFRRLADWAQARACPTVWSCLAAHAAVLHFDGVERRRLPAKCSGVYRLSGPGAPARAWTPHSRMNTLDEADLRKTGYRILRRAEAAGVDTFERPGFLLLQGHPEYEAGTLAAEYRRDVRRFLRGDRTDPPDLPVGYFDCGAEARLTELVTQARSMPADVVLAKLETVLAAARPRALWRQAAVGLYADWLAAIGCGDLRARA